MHGQQNLKYISHYDHILSLNMASVAETSLMFIEIHTDLFRLDLHLFYLLVYLKIMGIFCLKLLTFVVVVVVVVVVGSKFCCFDTNSAFLQNVILADICC
jgi:hypothetical protein